VAEQGVQIMQTDEVIRHIVGWLKAYCDDANLLGFVVGVSGGIDSAVTSALCAKTGKQVIVLSMPIHQASDQLSLAQQHIAWLEENHPRVKGITIDLTPSFQALERSFPADIQDGHTMANTRSRIRMVTLYAFSTHHKMLVVGTGNKVEDFGVGFYTKYGDGGVDILPIADLTKSEVYAIATTLDIGEGIVNAAPTDGLWHDNRTDERQIGATYPELEWAMQCEATSADEALLEPRQKEVLSIYRTFHQANRHKMEPIPVCKIPEALR
jgi:NAD+ synthase